MNCTNFFYDACLIASSKARDAVTRKAIVDFVLWLEYLVDAPPFVSPDGKAVLSSVRERNKKNFRLLLITAAQHATQELRRKLITAYGPDLCRLDPESEGDLAQEDCSTLVRVLKQALDATDATEAIKLRNELMRLKCLPTDPNFSEELKKFVDALCLHQKISPQKFSDEEKKEILKHFVGIEWYAQAIIQCPPPSPPSFQVILAVFQKVSVENVGFKIPIMPFYGREAPHQDSRYRELRTRRGLLQHYSSRGRLAPTDNKPKHKSIYKVRSHKDATPPKPKEEVIDFTKKKGEAKVAKHFDKCSTCHKGHKGECWYKHTKCLNCGGPHFTRNCQKPRNDVLGALALESFDPIGQLDFSPKMTPRSPIGFEEFGEPDEVFCDKEYFANSIPASIDYNKEDKCYLMVRLERHRNDKQNESVREENDETMMKAYLNVDRGSENHQNKNIIRGRNSNLYSNDRYTRDTKSVVRDRNMENTEQVMMIADSGCSFPMFGANALPYLTDLQRKDSHYLTAKGVKVCTQIGTLHGIAKAINGEYIPVTICGAVAPELPVSLINTPSLLLQGPTDSWIKLENIPNKLCLVKDGAAYHLKLSICRDNFALAARRKEVELSKRSQEEKKGLILDTLQKFGYIKYTSLGEILSHDMAIKSLCALIRHMHIRLLHVGPDNLRATMMEQGLPLERSMIERCLLGCRACRTKINMVRKVPSLPQRGKLKKAAANKVASDEVNAFLGMDGNSGTPLPTEEVTQNDSNYQGVGIHANHCILHDITYMPTMGLFGATGLSVIIDLKTKLISLAVVKGKAEDNSLCEETTQHLTSWCSSRGFPRIIKTDNGPEFSGLYHNYCMGNAINQQFGAPYCPFQQGTVERANGIIKRLIGIMLKVQNWPEDHWPIIAGCAQEIHNITASSATNESPHKAWYGIPPSLRLIPGDRIHINIDYYPAVRKEEVQKFGKTIPSTYLYRESRIARLACFTVSSGVTTYYAPLKYLGLQWISLYDAAVEGAKIFNELRSTDKVMRELNGLEVRNKCELERLIWDPLSQIPDVSSAPTPSTRKGISTTPNLDESLVNRVEALIRKRKKVEAGSEDEAVNMRSNVEGSPQEANSIPMGTGSVHPQPDDHPRKMTSRQAAIKAKQSSHLSLVMLTLEGKTHEDVSNLDILSGTHDTAMSLELEQFKKNNVVGEKISAKEAKDRGYKVISSRWVHSWKLKEDGRKPKSRLVIRGFLDKQEVPVFVEMPKGDLRRLSIILGLSSQKDAYIVDVRTAFLQAPIPDGRKIAVKFPSLMPPERLTKGFEAGGVHILKKAMYGLQDSPKAFCDWLKVQLVTIGWTSVGWGFFTRNNNGTLDIIVAYVDDLWIWSNDIDNIYKEISTLVSMDEPKPVTASWTRYIGVDVKRTSSTMQMSIASYVKGLDNYPVKRYIRDQEFPIKPAEDHEIDQKLSDEMAQIVGRIGWIAVNHPGVAYIYGELARHVAKPCARVLDLAKRVSMALKATPPFTLNYKPVHQNGELRVWTDASLKRQGLAGIGRNGYLIQYVNGSEPLQCRDNLVAWGSVVDKRKHPSTSSAEIAALLLGLKEAVTLVSIISALTRKRISLNAYIDAKVVQHQIQTGKAVSNPFDQSNIDYVLQCLQDLTLLGVEPEPQVRHVGTEQQKADGLTKYIKEIWADVMKFSKE